MVAGSARFLPFPKGLELGLLVLFFIELPYVGHGLGRRALADPGDGRPGIGFCDIAVARWMFDLAVAQGVGEIAWST